MTFTLGCFCSVSKSGQSWYFLFSAKLNSESGKMLYTKVVEDFISFQQYKDGHHMIQVAQDMPSASYCIYAETLSGWILCLAVLLKLSDRTG
jgi:hypothetical protein